MHALLVVALCCAAVAQDAAKPLPGDAFGRQEGVVDERAREEARELERDAEVLRALAQAQAMRQGGIVLGPGVRMADDANLSLARATVGRDAPRAAELPAGLRAIVTRMDDPAWSVREAASKEASSGAWTMQELRKALDEPSLSLEQRSRLEEALWLRWESKPRGAIGITMGQGLGGVLVTQVHEGFPASRVLRVGDVIEAIDGMPTPNNDGLVAVVQRRGPGERLRLSVVRGGPGGAAAVAVQQPAKAERLELDVELGDFAALERTNPRNALRPASRRNAFDTVMREEREGSSLQLMPIEPGLPPGFVGSTIVAGGRQPAGTSVNPKMAINQLRNTLEATTDEKVRALLEAQIAHLEQVLRDSQRQGGFGTPSKPKQEPIVPQREPVQPRRE
jgi:hypothetical protein